MPEAGPSLGHEPLGEPIDIREAAEHLSDEQGAIWLQHPIRLDQEIGVVGAHQGQAKHRNIQLFILQRYLTYVTLGYMLVFFTF